MAATVLNSPRAIEISLFIVRAFIRLRDRPAPTPHWPPGLTRSNAKWRARPAFALRATARSGLNLRVACQPKLTGVASVSEGWRARRDSVGLASNLRPPT